MKSSFLFSAATAAAAAESKVTVDGLPAVLKLGRVAECVATVRNRSSRPMTLQLQFRTDGMVGVYVHGQSFRNLGMCVDPLSLFALVRAGCCCCWC